MPSAWGKEAVTRLIPIAVQSPVRRNQTITSRDTELAIAGRALEQSGAGMAEHVAYVGPRAAGKTSILNHVEQLARRKGFAVCRLSPTEDMKVKPAFLFTEILRQLVESAGALGAYGGPADERFQLIANAFIGIGGKDLLSSPYRLPLVAYAHADIDPPLSPAVVVRDFQLLEAELAERTIPGGAILLDKGEAHLEIGLTAVNLAYVHYSIEETDEAFRYCDLVERREGSEGESATFLVPVLLPSTSLQAVPVVWGADAVTVSMVIRAACHIRGGKNREGVAQLSRAVSRGPSKAYVHRFAAWAHFAMDDKNAAEASMIRARLADPSDASITSELTFLREGQTRLPGFDEE